MDNEQETVNTETGGNGLDCENRHVLQDCAFQYYRGGRMVIDTALVTREEADELWEIYISDFKEACERGDDAEIALWVDMKYDVNYQKTAKRHHSQDVYTDSRGRFYEKVYF